MKFEWELLCVSDDKITETYRAKVIGGWLVKSFNCIYTDDVPSVSGMGGSGTPPRNTRRYAMAESIQFVSDPEHEWKIEK